MKSFKDYTEGKGYISLTVVDADSKKISDILDDLNIKDYVKDLHVTMMYDRSNPNLNYQTNNKVYKAKIKSFKTLGEPDSKWYSIALDLDSSELHDRHDELKNLGYTHSYPSFIAHVSLKYKPSEDDIKLLKDNIEKFKQLGSIHLHNEKLKKIEE